MGNSLLTNRTKLQKVQIQALEWRLVRSLGFRVQGLGLRVQGLGFRVQGLGLQGLGYALSGCRFSDSGFLSKALEHSSCRSSSCDVDA